MSEIKHLSLSEEVYSRLMRKILDGNFKEGSRLREEILCRELGVSRTPVREALIRLAREGILEQMPRRGCVLRKLPPEEIEELLTCRRLLECLVLREYFDGIDRKKCRALADKLDKAVKQGGDGLRTVLLSADEELHELIVSSCRNRFLSEELKRLQLLCRPYRVLRCAEADNTSSILEERRHIINAIISGNAEKAENALSSHFEKSSCYYLKDKEIEITS